MQPQDVTRVLGDPLAQELMQSSIPARLAYLGADGFPRAIPIGFHWNGIHFVLTVSATFGLVSGPKPWARAEPYSRWLVSRSRRFGPSCWTFRRDFRLQSRS